MPLITKNVTGIENTDNHDDYYLGLALGLLEILGYKIKKKDKYTRIYDKFKQNWSQYVIHKHVWLC